MYNSTGFGTYGNLDIINNDDVYGSAQDGKWFIGVATKESSQQFDAFSLELADNLVIGNSYTISYYDTESEKYTNINGCILQIGLSQSGDSFGDLIYTAAKPVKEWTQHSFDFMAPNKGKYITVKSVVGNSSYGGEWTLVDNFVIKSKLAVKRYGEGKQVPVISAKLIGSKVLVRFKDSEPRINLSIYTMDGKLTFRYSGTCGDALNVNTSFLSSGVYMIRINTDKSSHPWESLVTKR
jgi:hypothetical protein